MTLFQKVIFPGESDHNIIQGGVDKTLFFMYNVSVNDKIGSY